MFVFIDAKSSTKEENSEGIVKDNPATTLLLPRVFSAEKLVGFLNSPRDLI